MWLVTLIVSLGLCWGLFVYYIALAIKREKRKDNS